MKKRIFGIAICCLMASGLRAQADSVYTLPYSQGFESGLDGWTTIDYNADGHNWNVDSTGAIGVPGYDGSSSHFARSASYVGMGGGGDIAPDNFLVSPRIAVDSATVLRWWHRVQNSGWPADHYSVYVSTTGGTAADFLATAPVASITPTANDYGVWWQQSVDLSPYVGDTIRIAFRHHDCFGQFAIMIDGITVEHFASPWTVADTVPWATDFDVVDTGWTFIGRRNGWYIDTVESVSGRGMYVSGDGGATNSYYRYAWDSRFHWAVRPLHFDHGGDYRVDYDWHLNGYYHNSTSTYYDYLRVMLAPTTAELDTATFFGYGISAKVNSHLPYGWISLSDTNGRRLLAGEPDWTHHAQVFHVPAAGDYLLLVLSASGNNELWADEVAGAIDNLNIATLTCSNFADSLRFSANSNQGLTVSWTDTVGTVWAVYAGDSLYGVTTGHSFYLANPDLCAAAAQDDLAVGISPICSAGDTALPHIEHTFWRRGYLNNTLQCDPFVLPYSEDFSYYDIATANIFGWTNQGLLAQYLDTTRGHLDSTSLNMRAYTIASGLKNQMVTTPRFDAPANRLLVSFWLKLYSYAGMEADTIFQVGVLSNYDTLSYYEVQSYTTPVLTLLGSDGDGTWRHYQFATDGLADTALAGLVFTLVPHGSRTIDAYIDELEVSLLPPKPDSVPPTVVLTGPASAMAFLDTVTFTATLLSGDTTGLSYSWHSTLLDSTFTLDSNHLTIVYDTVGTDTISVVATNSFGSDTATHVLTVRDNLTVSIRGASTVYTGDTVHYAAIVGGRDTVGLAYSWHSTLLDSTFTYHTSHLTLNYTLTGVDTLTLTVTNSHGPHIATRVVTVLSCGIIHTFPYQEDFEDYGWQNRSACWLIRTPVGILDNEWRRAYAGANGNSRCMVSNGNGTHQPYEAWLIMPAIELPTNADSITFRFAHKLTYVDHFYVLASPSGDPYNDAFTDTLFSAVGSTGPGSWLADSLPLDAYRGCHIRIAFLHSAASGGLSHVSIDDIAIRVDTQPTPDTVWRTVSVTANVDGACETYGSGRYVDGSTVEIGYMVNDTMAEGGHWHFLGWSDGLTENPRYVIVTSDTAIVALFEWVEDSVGIAEIENSILRIEIYPNPAHGDVTVKVSEPSTLSVIDLTGRTIIPSTPVSSSLIIHHSSLRAGTYFVRVSSERGSTVKKLIVK